MIAHVGGLPLEEILSTLVGTSTGMLAVRAWLMLRLRRRREPSRSRCWTRPPRRSSTGSSPSFSA
jgi:hypothetical protein